jgi:hypothetical protein
MGVFVVPLMLVLWLLCGVICTVWPSTVNRYFSKEKGSLKTPNRVNNGIRFLGLSLILSGLVGGLGLAIAFWIAVSAR